MSCQTSCCVAALRRQQPCRSVVHTWQTPPLFASSLSSSTAGLAATSETAFEQTHCKACYCLFQIVPVTIPELDACRVAHIYTFGSEAACAHTQELQTPELKRQIASDVRITLALASTFTAQQFLQAQRIRTRMMTYMHTIFEAVDFMVTPTMPQGAPVIK